ncbi:hypothetical protein V6N11_016506 [Hibiscus sabdariffa]|uniref:Uncharacterized protein n=1 Tax=Hibiscus sabdariffa TaxID=183260 RepID=A0ABR2TVX7_9ROSI
MVVRKIEAQDDKLKDGENIGMNSGSANTKFENDLEKVKVMMEDESMEIVEGSHGVDAVSWSLPSPSVAQLAVSHPTALLSSSIVVGAVMIKNLDALFKGCIQPIQGMVDPITGNPTNELNLNFVHSVKLELNGNISKLNFARKVYSRATSIFYSNMVRRTPTEFDFGTVIDKLSGPYVLRDRLKEFVYVLEADQLGKLAQV